MGKSLTLLIHGDPGVGKSWLAATAPPPRLILDVEGGTKFLPGEQVIWSDPDEAPPDTVETCVLHVRDLKTVTSAMAWLHRGLHPFNSIIVDSLSELQKRLVDEVAGTEQLQLQDWGTVFRKGEALVRSFRDLTGNPVKPVYCVVFVTLTRDLGDKVVTHKPYVQGQIGLTLPGFVDVVGALRVREEEGELRRSLLVSPISGYVAKDRTGRLGTVVEDPDLVRIFKTVYASRNGARKETT